MKHIWSVLCAHAIVEQETNTVSLMNVIEQITVQFNEPAVPTPGPTHMLPIPLQLVTLWQRDPGKTAGARFKVFLRTPRDPQPQGHAEGTIDAGSNPRARITTKVPGIPWLGEGIYAFVVQLFKKREWTTVAEVPFWLKLGTPAAQSPTQSQTTAPATPKTRKKRSTGRKR